MSLATRLVLPRESGEVIVVARDHSPPVLRGPGELLRIGKALPAYLVRANHVDGVLATNGGDDLRMVLIEEKPHGRSLGQRIVYVARISSGTNASDSRSIASISSGNSRA